MKKKLIMSTRKLNQIEIFEKLTGKEIKQKKATKILNLSIRQVKRKFRKKGHFYLTLPPPYIF